MGIGVSVFLLAVGAILAFAVEVEAEGLDINAVGVILMIIGLIGLVASFLFWERMGIPGVGARRTTVVRDDLDDDIARPRRVVRERTIVSDDDTV